MPPNHPRLRTVERSKMLVSVVEVISTPAYAECQLPGDEIRSLDVADRSIPAIDRSLVLPPGCEDANRPDHNGYHGWDEGQKHRAQCAPGERDLAKRLGTDSPNATTKQFENPSTCKADVGHDSVDHHGDHSEEWRTRNTDRLAEDMLCDKPR
jgi:hypothetical protein